MGRVKFICFASRRSRALPACRYFQVDPSNGAARITRRLQLLDWVEEKPGTPEEWIEMTP